MTLQSCAYIWRKTPERIHAPPVFITTLFTIAKTWKKPKCPSIEAWIKEMWYTMEYYSAIKNNNAVCSNINGPKEYHTEWSKSDKERDGMTSLICGILSGTNQLNRNRLTDLREWTYGCLGVGGGEGCGERIVRKFGMDMYTLLHLKWIANKDLLTARGWEMWKAGIIAIVL